SGRRAAASASVLDERLQQQRADRLLRLRGPGRVVLEGRLVHVDALADLQLHGLDAARRVGVMPGDVAAAETAVVDPVVARLAGQHRLQAPAQRDARAGAAGGAEVEVGQAAL